MKKLLLGGLIGFASLQGSYAQHLRETVVLIRPKANAALEESLKRVAKRLNESQRADAASLWHFYAAGGGGSGFIYVDHKENKEKVKDKNYVFTNRHVVEQAESVEIVQVGLDGQETVYPAEIFHIDPVFDLAILTFKTKKGPLKKGLAINGQGVTDGAEIWSAGYPGAANAQSWQLARGIVSNSQARLPALVDPDISYVIQHTAAVYGGSSGGPLLIKDYSGAYRAVGINTWKSAAREAQNFSLPAKDLLAVFEEAKAADKKTSQHTLAGAAQKFVQSVYDRDYEALEPMISFEWTAKQGWQALSYILKTSPEAKEWFNRFALMPIKTMRQAIAYCLTQEGIAKKLAISYGEVAKYSAKPKESASLVSFRTGSQDSIFSWIWQQAGWAVCGAPLLEDAIPRPTESDLPQYGADYSLQLKFSGGLAIHQGQVYPNGLVSFGAGRRFTLNFEAAVKGRDSNSLTVTPAILAGFRLPLVHNGLRLAPFAAAGLAMEIALNKAAGKALTGGIGWRAGLEFAFNSAPRWAFGLEAGQFVSLAAHRPKQGLIMANVFGAIRF